MPYGITQSYLPADSDNIPALHSSGIATSRLASRFSDPGGMHGWVDLLRQTWLFSPSTWPRQSLWSGRSRAVLWVVGVCIWWQTATQQSCWANSPRLPLKMVDCQRQSPCTMIVLRQKPTSGPPLLESAPTTVEFVNIVNSRFAHGGHFWPHGR